MPFRIRKADEKDIDSLCRLMTELAGHDIIPEQMKDRLEFIKGSPIDELFVCEEEGRISSLLGFRIRVNLEEVSQFAEITAIVVRPEYRKRGVGCFMMNFAEKRAKELGCKGLWLVSGFGREEEAHDFYKRLGYRFVKPLE